MISYHPTENELRVTIAVDGIYELCRYQNGLLGVLSTIPVTKCDEQMKEHVKSVYQLLSHLRLDAQLLSQHEVLLREYREVHANGKIHGL